MSELSEAEQLKDIRKIYNEYKKLSIVLKTYNEFKRLRETLGKPVVSFLDPETIKENLSGKEFLKLIKQIRREKYGVTEIGNRM